MLASFFLVSFISWHIPKKNCQIESVLHNRVPKFKTLSMFAVPFFLVTFFVPLGQPVSQLQHLLYIIYSENTTKITNKKGSELDDVNYVNDLPPVPLRIPHKP